MRSPSTWAAGTSSPICYDSAVGGGRHWLLVIACALGCAQGEGDNVRSSAEIGEASTTDASTSGNGSSSATTSATGSPGNCVPGQQIACACPGGTDGAQACLPDGSGYGVCECPDDEDGSEASTAVADVTGMSEGSTGDTMGGDACEGPCDSCILCAATSVCNEEFGACNSDMGCTAMISCTMECGFDDACVDSCVQQMGGSMESFGLFSALRDCVLATCTVCDTMGG